MKDEILLGDAGAALDTVPDESVDCIVTSPPYFGLRDYGKTNQIGLERTPEEYVEKIVQLFRKARRCLKKQGTLWLNLGDSYAGSGKGFGDKNEDRKYTSAARVRTLKKAVTPTLKSKDLIGIPWRVAFALQADGWYLRQDIIWHKPNPMPESVTDRCTKAHEYIFLLTKSPTYFFDNEAIKEQAIYGGSAERIARAEEEHKRNPTATVSGIRPRDKRAGKGRIAYEGKRTSGAGDSYSNGQQSFVSIPEKRNKRSVWSVTTRPFKGAHFATFPEKLIEPMILAGCPRGGVVLDPFMGSGTPAVVAKRLGRHYLGIELNSEYIKIAEGRIGGVTLPLL